jgi:hypothetical protein
MKSIHEMVSLIYNSNPLKYLGESVINFGKKPEIISGVYKIFQLNVYDTSKEINLLIH